MDSDAEKINHLVGVFDDILDMYGTEIPTRQRLWSAMFDFDLIVYGSRNEGIGHTLHDIDPMNTTWYKSMRYWVRSLVNTMYNKNGVRDFDVLLVCLKSHFSDVFDDPVAGENDVPTS